MNFVTNRPYLKENLKAVYCIVFSIFVDRKHISLYFNAL